MTTSNTHDACLLLASPLCHALAEGLTQTCNVPWQCGSVAPSPSRGSLAEAQEIYSLTFNQPLAGRCFIAILPQDGAASEPGNKTGTVATAVQAMLQRIKTQLRGSVGDVNVTLAPVQADELPTEDAAVLHADLRSEEVQLSVQLLFDAALVNALQQPQIEKSLASLMPRPAVHSNLDLVMDVALSVSLRFGRRQLPLREVIELTSGSVVELDRQVDEPVELVLDGRVVARGEAVIIDGNYGMRVTQIVQPLLNV